MRQTYLLDLDGVTYDLVTPFDNRMAKKGIPPINKTSYNLEKRYGIPRERVWSHLIDFVEKERAFLHIPLFEGADIAVEHLNQKGNLVIATARQYNEQAMQDTYERLSQDFPSLVSEQIIIAKEKGDVAKEIGATISFEDMPENAFDIIQKSDSLVKLINQGYNQKPINNLKITRHASLYEATFENSP